MTFLTPKERQTLALICDTLAPALTPANGENPLLFGTSAADMDLPDKLEYGLENATDEMAQAQLKQLLGLLESGVFNGILLGQWTPFSQLSLEARTELLYGMATHRLELLRKAFNGIKRLALFLYYSSAASDGNPNPFHSIFEYQVSKASADAERPIKPLKIDVPTTLDTDVLIIGSGAGGGVVAGELTEAGFDVIVVEKGEYWAEGDFHGRELDSNERLYEKYGALTTADTSMPVLAGSVLGGGTTINWTGSLRTPDYVLDEWERAYGFEGVTSADFQKSFDAVSARMSIGTSESIPNANTAAFERGLNALGCKVTVIPRNVKGCEDCGFCNFGCAFGAKQGTLKTYLQDAYDRGARIVVRAYVEKILHSNGKVTGAQLLVQKDDGTTIPVTVRAKAVIASAGSIHNPALLLRSGLTNPNIGKHLRLHPTTVTSGLFDEPMRPWQGAPMTRLTTDFADLDGKGYGVRLMNAPGHPGIFALAAAWQSGRQHKQVMQQMEYHANIIIIARDFHSGQVKVDQKGNPIIHYRLHPYDARHMQRGIKEALRIHLAAGAYEVTAPQNVRPVYRPGRDGTLDSYLARVEALGLRPNDFALFSAHQMSSCRIAGSAKDGVADPNGETYEVKNLFIVDGSALPTCSGVNPMLSILGTAHFLSQRIKARLGKA